jgi:septal ring factor EnvC (AmiA/AmiB activator)
MLVAVASVLLCGIVLNFVAQTEDYQKRYDDMKRSTDSQIQKLDGQVKQLNDTLAKAEQEKNALNTQISTLSTQMEQSRVALSNSERERAAAQTKYDNLASIVQDFQKTNEQHALTLKTTIDKLDQTEAQTIKMQTELNQTNQALIEKMAIIDTLQAEKKRLLEEKTEFESRLNLMLQPAGQLAAAPAPVTPIQRLATPVVTAPIAQDIKLQGMITEVDLKNSMVGISIGTADAVSEGMTFHVIRGDEFICDILIIDVDTEQAVGVLDVVHKQPQVGDKVSTNF